MPRLARITVYPIKSLDGVGVGETGFVSTGGLHFDRRFAMRGLDGQWINGKRFPALHAVRATYDLAASTVKLAVGPGPSTELELRAGNLELIRWFADYLHQPVELVEDRERGIPDDFDTPGPTVVSVATIEAVAAWFPPLTIDEVRRRFRANLEFDGEGDDECPPFWEDRLFAADASPKARNVVAFRIGEAELQGVNPCARCPVPTRDSQTGEVWPRFGVEFSRRREQTLPAWAPRTAFDHFYRLSVNTLVAPAEVGKTIRTGDGVKLVAQD